MVVFVTAFDRFAIDAFEAHALDYLLKPVDDSRLARALDRVRAQWQQKQAARATRTAHGAAGGPDAARARSAPDALAGSRPCAAAPAPAGTRRYATLLPIRSGRETLRLDVGTIDWIDAAGDYMCLHAAGQTHVLRATMKELEDMLDPQVFQRVHRSTIVNLARVRSLRPHLNGECFLKLQSGPGDQAESQFSRQGRDCCSTARASRRRRPELRPCGSAVQRAGNPWNDYARAACAGAALRLRLRSPHHALPRYLRCSRSSACITLLALVALWLGQAMAVAHASRHVGADPQWLARQPRAAVHRLRVARPAAGSRRRFGAPILVPAQSGAVPVPSAARSPSLRNPLATRFAPALLLVEACGPLAAAVLTPRRSARKRAGTRSACFDEDDSDEETVHWAVARRHCVRGCLLPFASQAQAR